MVTFVTSRDAVWLRPGLILETHMPLQKSLEIWTAQTLCDIGILLSVVSFFLHIGRPYFERILSRFTLRVAADLWWVLYIILRDGSLFASLLLGFLTLNLDLMADIKVGLPFVPLGTVAMAGAVVLKVFRNAEDLNPSYQASSLLVIAGAFLNTIGYVFVMEGPGDEYSAAQTLFWQTLRSWRSNENPHLATVTFYIAILILIVLIGYAAVKSMRLWRATGTEEHSHAA